MRWTILWVLLITVVLLPFILVRRAVRTHSANRSTRERTRRAGWSARAVFSLLALDVFLPVPSSIVSTGAGVLLGFYPRRTVVVWSGMMVGALLGYTVGSRGPARGQAAGRRRRNRARLAVHETVRRPDHRAICRPVPVLAEASVVFAGLVHARLRAVRAADRGLESSASRWLRRGRCVFAPPRCLFVPDRLSGCAGVAGPVHRDLSRHFRPQPSRPER